MTQNCSVCNHPKRTEIEELLLKDVSFEHIVERYNTKENKLFMVNISFHRGECMALTIKTPIAIEALDDDVSANSLGVLLSRFELLYDGLKGIEPVNSKDAYRKTEAMIKILQGELRVIDVYEKIKRDRQGRDVVKQEKDNIVSFIKDLKKKKQNV